MSGTSAQHQLSSLTPEAQHGTSARGGVWLIVVTVVVLTLPFFLLAAQFPLIRSELDLTLEGLGALAALFFLLSALASAVMGPLVDRIGASRCLALALALAIPGNLALAALASGLPGVILAVAVCGVANGLGQPSANVALYHASRPDRRGAVYGLKQAAIPMAGFMAGLALPSLAPAWGWRAAFWANVLAAAALAVVIATRRRTLLRPPPHPAVTGGRAGARRELVVTALAMTSGAGAGAAFTAYSVESLVRAGADTALAGLLFAAANVAGIAGRIGWGMAVDRGRLDGLRIVALSLPVGAIAFVGMGFGGSVALMAVCLFVGFLLGWSWPGLVFHEIARRHERRRGTALGLTGMGGAVGAGLGSAVFGVVAQRASLELAWSLVATAAIVSAAAFAWVGWREAAPASPGGQPPGWIDM